MDEATYSCMVLACVLFVWTVLLLAAYPVYCKFGKIQTRWQAAVWGISTMLIVYVALWGGIWLIQYHGRVLIQAL